MTCVLRGTEFSNTMFKFQLLARHLIYLLQLTQILLILNTESWLMTKMESTPNTLQLINYASLPTIATSQGWDFKRSLQFLTMCALTCLRLRSRHEFVNAPLESQVHPNVDWINRDGVQMGTSNIEKIRPLVQPLLWLRRELSIYQQYLQNPVCQCQANVRLFDWPPNLYISEYDELSRME